MDDSDYTDTNESDDGVECSGCNQSGGKASQWLGCDVCPRWWLGCDVGPRWWLGCDVCPRWWLGCDVCPRWWLGCDVCPRWWHIKCTSRYQEFVSMDADTLKNVPIPMRKLHVIIS